MHLIVERCGNRRGDGGLVEHDDDRRAEISERFACGQHGVDGSSIADVVAVAVEHHHRSTGPQAHQVEIREARRISVAEHQAIAERALDALAHPFAHLGRIHIGHDDECDAPPGVRSAQLVDHVGKQAGCPQHHDVVRFDDGAPPAFHAVDLRLHSARDHADERAENEQTEDRHAQRDQALTRTGVAGHGARVERSEQALPEVLEPTCVLAPGERDAAAAEQERRDQDNRERDDSEPQQHRPGTSCEQAVEAVPEELAPGRSIVRTPLSAHAAPSHVQITRIGR